MQVGYQTFDCKADRVFDKSLVANLSAVPEQQRVHTSEAVAGNHR